MATGRTMQSWTSSTTASRAEIKIWIKDGSYPLMRDGTHWPRGTAFWQAVRARASEILERGALPGDDYALTEVVHCKSEREQGVHDALELCVNRYLGRVLSVAGAPIIVVLGEIAKQAIAGHLGIPTPVAGTVHGPVKLGDRERLVAFLPHPNARLPRRFAYWPESLTQLKAFLQAAAGN
jgi:hypothetical protein